MPEDPRTTTICGEFSKLDEERRIAFGWAYTAKIGDAIVLDHSEEFIDDIALPDLENAVYAFVKDVRQADEMHLRDDGIGVLVESVMLTEEKMEKMGITGERVGWWTGWKVLDDQVWAKIKDGTYPMFSIRGIGEREHVEDALLSAGADTSLSHE